MELVRRYFPFISELQAEQFSKLEGLYRDWNRRINVISRKDMENFEIHHLLHSLSIAKFTDLPAGTRILDAGTGGGFPGIPLAIMFPSSEFTLLDSTAKKIRVVSEIARTLGLRNVDPVWKRLEDEKGKFDLVISRAVMKFETFARFTRKNLDSFPADKARSGIICLKGGELRGELGKFLESVIIQDIKEYFTEPYFETKKIVFLPATGGYGRHSSTKP